MNTHATHSPMNRNPGTSAVGIVVAAFGAIMIALASGALWLLLCLAIPSLHARTWIAVPLAFALARVIRGWVVDAAWPAAVLAALATLLACGYMRVLLVASDLAGSFGMDFMQALRHAGLGMLVHLAWLSTDGTAVGVYALSTVLAGVLAWRFRPRTRARTDASRPGS